MEDRLQVPPPSHRQDRGDDGAQRLAAADGGGATGALEPGCALPVELMPTKAAQHAPERGRADPDGDMLLRRELQVQQDQEAEAQLTRCRSCGSILLVVILPSGATECWCCGQRVIPIIPTAPRF